MSVTGWTPVQEPNAVSGWTPVTQPGTDLAALQASTSSQAQSQVQDAALASMKRDYSKNTGMGLDANGKPVSVGEMQTKAAPEDAVLETGTLPQKIHRAATNVGANLTPVAGVAAFASPFSFLSSLAGGIVGQKSAQAGAEAAGASPDWADVAGDVGGVAGGIAGGVTGSKVAETGRAMVGKVSRLSPEEADTAPPAGKLQPALNNTPREVLDYATSKGIELAQGEGLQTPLARTTQGLGERSLANGNAIAESRQENTAKLMQNVVDFANRADPYKLGADESSAGATIQQNARIAQNVARDNASAAYKNLPDDLMDAPVDVSSVNSKYFQAMKKAQLALANRNPQMAAQIQAAYDQFSNVGTPTETESGTTYKKAEVPFSVILKMRSDTLQDGNALARAGAPDEVQALYRQAAGDLDSLAEKTADSMGAAKDWRAANAGWKDYQGKYGDSGSPLYKALNQSDPALVTRSILNRASPQDINLMQDQHMDGALEALRRQVITDIGNRGFKIQAEGLGNYSDSFLKSLFGPDGTKELYINADLARRMNFQVNPSGTSNVLLGMEQFGNPKYAIAPALLAKAAMPKPAASYLPSGRVPPAFNVPNAVIGGMVPLRSLLGGSPSQ